MNEIEEKLWNYIDGSCSDEEKNSISLLIESNEAYKLKYKELLQLNAEFSAMELDEPSMAFTYNVMEAIRNEIAQKPLKAAINKRVIWGISAFFILIIVAVLAIALGSVNWTAINSQNSFHMSVKFSQLQNYFTGPVVKGFIFFDIILGLYLLDAYLRKKLTDKRAS